jgi:hypothetical protein
MMYLSQLPNTDHNGIWFDDDWRQISGSSLSIFFHFADMYRLGANGRNKIIVAATEGRRCCWCFGGGRE